MSTNPLGTYTFLPWLRHGVANRITGPATTQRATINVALQIETTPKSGSTTSATQVSRAVELYGPGDIIGIDQAQISRVEPPAWVTNFEPNYLAAIEFYDEDFPWRYSPAAPVGRRLLPWLALVVLEEETEFKEAGNVAGKPLPFVQVTANFADVFPDPSEGWAWAHSHFNTEFSSLVVETDANKAGQTAQQVINSAPDTACSRILCPRKLKPKTGYHAFLIPAFESGRLAGLGRDPKPLFDDAANGLSAISSAWGSYAVPVNRPEPNFFPFYYRWYFRTAENGDFESLVRLLKPKPVDSRVGHRDLDVTDPAPNITGIEDAKLGGILRLGGALKAPFETLSPEEQEEFEKYDQWATPYPHSFQSQLAAFINLADSYQVSGAAANANTNLNPSINNDVDPLVTPPIYGRWHALTERLLTERDGSDVQHRENWVHDLNLDPRWRVAAGFGTKVIQENQEPYMEAAWRQIGDVLEANRRIRQAQLAKVAGRHLYEVNIKGAARVSPETVVLKTAPLMARVLSAGVTVRHGMRRSPMNVATTSTAMRSLIRPGGRIAKRLGLAQVKKSGELVARANAGTVSAAPAKKPPAKILSPDDLGEIPPIILLTQQQPKLNVLPERIREDDLEPGTIEGLPRSSVFRLIRRIDPRTEVMPAPAPPSETDSDDAARFKTALRNEFQVISKSKPLGDIAPGVPLSLTAIADDIVAGIRPDVTVPRRIYSGLTIPPHIKDQVGESFVEVMAYPEFDIPMYEPLLQADTDGFVPNIHLVEPNSVTLLETNQKFIEAYMVGINHEFARELLWREYPTDQRGSYFRQFWDVRKKIAAATDKEAAREKFKDIRPLHRWPIDNDLGDNDNREQGTEPEQELVLVIRGELLKKYPNAIISAQPARWQLTGGVPDKSKERELDGGVGPILPLYEARVAPDIYFFGFDLTAVEARGDDTVDDKPGWFFRIEEVAGDARFGFDISRDPADDINVWNDLAWTDVVPGLTDGKQIKVSNIPARTLVEPVGGEIEKHVQWDSDRQVPLDANVSAAELAYIALQTPVIMAIHASELLPNQES